MRGILLRASGIDWRDGDGIDRVNKIGVRLFRYARSAGTALSTPDRAYWGAVVALGRTRAQRAFAKAARENTG